MTAAPLGAPGVYQVPVPAPPPAPGAVRLDVTGFVGIAPRGPVGVPVSVESWEGYVRVFGGQGTADCPGLLGYAVRAFFRQGGARAWVVRVAPPGPPPPKEGDPTATHALDPSVCSGDSQLEFGARGEGAWGNGLNLRLEVAAGPQFPISQVSEDGKKSLNRFAPPDGVSVPPWSLLLVRSDDTEVPQVLGWVVAVTVEPAVLADAGMAAAAQATARRPVVTFGTDLPARGALTAALVTGTLQVTDDDDAVDRTETFESLGLRPEHARWIAGVVCTESRLVVPAGEWWFGAAEPLMFRRPPPLTAASVVRNPGWDRYTAINEDSFFDPDDAPSDPDADELPDPCDAPFTNLSQESQRRMGASPGSARMRHRGVDALVPAVDELGLLVVPDLLYAPREVTTADPVIPLPPAQPRFGPCRPVLSLTYTTAPSAASVLDGIQDRDEILRRQARLLRRTAPDRPWVVLLDAPPGLPVELVRAWRTCFDTSFAAAYHPWLWVPAPDGRSVLVPPSAFGAGIVAAREARVGVAWGPANELALDAVNVAQTVTDEQHAVLHREGVNVFRPDPDGVRLTGARTLSRDPAYRQLSVRRIMTQLRLTIAQRLAWAVFEPNTHALRTAVRLQLVTLLRGQYRVGALVGASEAEAFFVRCDDSNNPPDSIAHGRLVAELGVRPAEPIEFLLVRVGLEAESGVTVGEAGR